MPSIRHPSVRALAAALLAVAALSPAHAADDSPTEPTEPSTLNEPVPLWEVGAVAIAAYQPAYPGSDQDIGRIRLLPYGLYRGSFLRVDDNGVGVRALKTPRFEWDASASAAFGSSANRVHARRGMPSIGTLVEFGPALRVNLGDLVHPGRDARLTRLEIPVRAVFDANDGFAHKGWDFEPRLSHTAWQSGTASLVVSGSLLFGDRSLNDLYYGVGAPDAVPGRPAYRASTGLVATRLGASLRHRLTNTLRMTYFATVETVRGAANEDSPLVRSKQDAGLGVTLTWGVWHSKEMGVE